MQNNPLGSKPYNSPSGDNDGGAGGWYIGTGLLAGLTVLAESVTAVAGAVTALADATRPVNRPLHQAPAVDQNGREYR